MPAHSYNVVLNQRVLMVDKRSLPDGLWGQRWQKVKNAPVLSYEEPKAVAKLVEAGDDSAETVARLKKALKGRVPSAQHKTSQRAQLL